MPPPALQPPDRNPFFPLTVFFGGLFIVTILALLAALFGDPEAPLARLFDRYAGWMLAGEVVGILVVGFLALMVDRRQSRRREDGRMKDEGFEMQNDE
ncbi:MAG: hypothetical protein ACKV0T_19005 [Planctomycetales bacterium]